MRLLCVKYDKLTCPLDFTTGKYYELLHDGDMDEFIFDDFGFRAYLGKIGNRWVIVWAGKTAEFVESK